MTTLSTVLCSAVLFALASSAAAAPIEVLLLDGQSGGPYHNWKLTTPILKKELEETGLFKVTVLTAPPSDGDFSSIPSGVRQLPGDRVESRLAFVA